MSPSSLQSAHVDERESTVRGRMKWLRWVLPFVAIQLPILLLGFYSLNVASSSVQSLVRAESLSATSNISRLVLQDMLKIFTVADAVASLAGTVEAMEDRDAEAINARLRAIVLSYPQIDRAFVTDAAGVLWSDHPSVPGSIGSRHVTQDWYQGLSDRWKPVISQVYVRPFDHVRIVAIAVPVRSGDDRVIGSLVLEYKAERITQWLQDIHVSQSGYVYVLDHKGNVVAHPKLPEEAEIHEGYADLPSVKRALEGEFSIEEYRDPESGTEMIGSFLPLSIGMRTWVVTAQQPSHEAFATLNTTRRNIIAASAFLSILTLSLVALLAHMSRRNERLNRELNDKNRTLQDITSFVSHQLRAPVTAMRWTIEGMIDGDYGAPAPALATELQKLHEVATQNGKLIDDILNVSRIDRGVIEVGTEQTDLKDIAERAMRDYVKAAEKAGLTLSLERSSSKIVVMADKEKMAEAVTNAISNAIKHTKSGGITLKLRHDETFGYIDVVDTGEGMSADIMNNLFSRAGVKGKNSDSAKSTGLGLFIARNFMRLQGGDITVRSEPGKGSTFTYSIPLEKIQESIR